MNGSPFSLWQSQSGSAEFISPKACAERADKFDRQIRIRNGIEYSAGALTIAIFTALTIGAFVKGEVLIAIASAVIVAGIVRVLWALRRHASNLEPRPEDACVTHLRRQFEHQYKALSTILRWYIGPLIPGLLLFFAAITVRTAETAGWSKALTGGLGSLAMMAGLIGVIVLVNWIAARSLKRKIAAIDDLA